MNEMTFSDFKHKTVLIMGLGLHGGGVGAARFFARLKSRVIVTDLKSRKELVASLKKLRRFKGIIWHLGGHRPDDFRKADYVIKNPGVPQSSKFLAMAQKAGVAVLSDVEIFLKISPGQIIGITGTKGKSTTTALLGQFLQKGLRRRVWVGGNIRTSVLEFLAKVKKDDVVVLELSSFQLDSLAQSRLSPQIAVITNIFPDHFNRYPSFSAYTVSKTAVFQYQKPQDMLFIPWHDSLLERMVRKAPAKVLRVKPEKVLKPYRSVISPALPEYQRVNVALAAAVATRLGVKRKVIGQVLKTFRGLAGRMELVRKIRGVEFINDTTATNPTAAKKAVEATKKRIGWHNLHVIAGGYDKGLEVRGYVRALARQARSIIFLPGSATERIKGALLRGPRADGLVCYEARTMAEAVRVSQRFSKRGDVVLLSPGAASFGLFKHEFDRGEKFSQAVRKLK